MQNVLMDEIRLVCCLCRYQSSSELDLEGHIDQYHADIFRLNSAIASNYNQELKQNPVLPSVSKQIDLSVASEEGKPGRELKQNPALSSVSQQIDQPVASKEVNPGRPSRNSSRKSTSSMVHVDTSYQNTASKSYQKHAASMAVVAMKYQLPSGPSKNSSCQTPKRNSSQPNDLVVPIKRRHSKINKNSSQENMLQTPIKNSHQHTPLQEMLSTRIHNRSNDTLLQARDQEIMEETKKRSISNNVVVINNSHQKETFSDLGLKKTERKLITESVTVAKKRSYSSTQVSTSECHNSNKIMKQSQIEVNELNSCKEELDQLKVDLAESRKANEELKSKQSNYEHNKVDLINIQSRHELLLSKFTAKQSDIELMHAQLKNQELKNGELFSQLTKKEADFIQIQSELQNQELKYDKLFSDFKNKESYYVKLEDKLKMTAANCEEIQTELNLKIESEKALKINVEAAEKRNIRLEENLVKMTTKKAQLEEQNRNLTISTNDMKKAADQLTELSESLKKKTTELTRTKMSEGRLQIEVKKMHSDMEQCKDNYNVVQSKLTTVMTSYKSLKADCDRYQIIKSAMEKVFEKDDKYIDPNFAGDVSFNSLDEDDVCEIIKSFILESFNAKEYHYCEMKKSLDRIHNLNLERDRSNEQFTNKLNSLKSNNYNLKCELQNVRDSEVKSHDLLKEREKSALASVSILEKDLHLIRAKENEMKGIIEDFKGELMELEKIVSSLQTKNEELEKQHRDQVDSLKCQLVNQEKSAVASQLKNAESQAQMEELKTELFEIEKLVQSMSDKSDEHLKREVESLVKIDLLNEELKESKHQLTALMESSSKLMNEKEERISTLQKENSKLSQNQNIENYPELERALKAKTIAEEKLSNLENNLKKQESDYFEALRVHSESLKVMKLEVTNILADSEEQINEMKEHLKMKDELLKSSNKEVERKCAQVEKLKSKMYDLIDNSDKEKNKLLLDLNQNKKLQKSLKEEKFKLYEELTGSQAELKLLKKKVTLSDSKISKLEEHIRIGEAEKESLFQELISHEKIKKEMELNVPHQIVDKVKSVEKELLNKENELEETKKDCYRKHEQIKSLQLEITEFSKQLTTMETDRQKSLEDMAWAQNYCFGMDKKIKELENELAKYRPVLLESHQPNNHLVMSQQTEIDEIEICDANKSEAKKAHIVKLKIRKKCQID